MELEENEELQSQKDFSVETLAIENNFITRNHFKMIKIPGISKSFLVKLSCESILQSIIHDIPQKALTKNSSSNIQIIILNSIINI